MALTGKIEEDEWSVRVEIKPATDGHYRGEIHVSHRTQNGACTHVFSSHKKFPTEREAVLAGLCEGMIWIELKCSNVFHVTNAAPGETQIQSSS